MYASFLQSAVSIDPLALRVLRGQLRGQLLTPESPEYAAASAPWQLHVAQRPAAVVMAAGASDVVAAVRFAAQQRLPVAVQATGHGAVLPADGALLINTAPMQGVRIDAASRTARVAAGTKWGPVLEAAQDAGLAPLLGSTPNVGVVGYSLGGGIGWLARKYGPAVDSVRALDIVTADGELRHVDAFSDPELFWGARGGAGNFGAVTSVELDLYPVTQVYGGNTFFPIARAREVLAAYAAWAGGLSDDWTTSVVLMHMPPLPFIPEPLRGQSVAIVRGCYAGPASAAEADLAEIRALGGAIIDAFGPMSFRDVAQISQDPLDPMNTAGATETLAGLSAQAIDALIAVIGTPATSPLAFVEVRQMGGALARAPQRPSAFSQRDMPFVALMVAGIFAPEQEASAVTYLSHARAALAPHVTGQIYQNFLHDTDISAARVKAGFSPATYARLVALKDAVDPGNMFRFNRNIAPSKG